MLMISHDVHMKHENDQSTTNRVNVTVTMRQILAMVYLQGTYMLDTPLR